MHVISPARYQTRVKRRVRWSYAFMPFVLLVVVGSVNYARALPAATVTIHTSVPAPVATNLYWPANGQAAVAASRYGLLDTSGDQTPLATASIAKVILALCVLQKERLTLGQTGPAYTVDAQDVAIYNNYVAEDGSLVPVQQGEQITEYQALEALMLPSANNIADALARWVFGSQNAYSTYATEYLQQHGIDNTQIGTDASGFNPSTTSTASDLTQLGLLALKQPVLLQIANQSSAVLPVVGTVQNYDTVLGRNGITGLKTGNNNTDPGAFLFTAAAHVGTTVIPLTGTVMGAPNLETALQESAQLASSLERGFEQTTLVNAGQVVGTMHTAWGASASVVTVSSMRLVRWKAAPITEKHRIDTRQRSGTIGTLTATAGPNNTSTTLRLEHTVTAPSIWWRLTRH